MKKEVVILGGGFAGLAAAVDLVSRGHHVTLFEKKGHLGGRTYSFREPITGSTLDNGQHVFMGCYRSTLRLLEKIGRLADVHFQRRLKVSYRVSGGRGYEFATWPLPDPLHLLAGFASFRGLSLFERFRAMRVRAAADRPGDGVDRLPASEWLKRLGQGEKLVSRLWRPLILAALNEEPERASSALFRTVLKEFLFSGRRNSRIGFSRVGLSELFAEPAREFIEANGGKIFLNTGVARLHFFHHDLHEVELVGGRRISPEVLVVALPFGALRKVLPEWMVYQDPFFHPLHLLRSSPIVSINLWYEADFVDRDFVGFWDSPFHWLFHRGRILGDGRACYSLVISGAHKQLAGAGKGIVELAQSEMERFFPAAGKIPLLHSYVMKEPEATLSPVVGVNSLRLPQKTPYRNLFLAGDWTDTGLPATIEGAVRSAERVVALIDGE